MKKLCALGALALLLACFAVDDASAQRGGGFRGGGFGGGFRGAAIGGGFRGSAIGTGFRGWGGRGFVGRPVALGGGRRGWGWGVPLALGVGVSAGYYGSCYRWNGWDWVNVCYDPYYAGYPYYW